MFSCKLIHAQYQRLIIGKEAFFGHIHSMCKFSGSFSILLFVDHNSGLAEQMSFQKKRTICGLLLYILLELLFQE